MEGTLSTSDWEPLGEKTQTRASPKIIISLSRSGFFVGHNSYANLAAGRTQLGSSKRSNSVKLDVLWSVFHSGISAQHQEGEVTSVHL